MDNNSGNACGKNPVNIGDIPALLNIVYKVSPTITPLKTTTKRE